jgi:flavin reductase (DIM6/NTAB) family NADH-FMN oxidoreductase RutF
MNKIKIDTNAFVYPVPVVIVGTMVRERPNFMTVGWVSRVNYNPPLIAFASAKFHYTNKGIQEHKTFSINIPTKDLIKPTDYCGLVSGKQIDKSKVFDLFYGDLSSTPMIRQCPLSMECTLIKEIDLPTNTLFIGEIVAAYSEEQYLTDGHPDINKFEPFTLTMPDNNYWLVGKNIGKAWGIGQEFKADTS